MINYQIISDSINYYKEFQIRQGLHLNTVELLKRMFSKMVAIN